MLIYDEHDEWIIPGEIEYAREKSKEMEQQIQNHNRNLGTFLYWTVTMYVQITEHVAGKFEVDIPEAVWSLPDIDVCNDAILDWFRDEVAPIDGPKIFALPADDVRNRLPDWDDSFISDSSYKNIIGDHSSRYNAAKYIDEMDGEYGYLCREFGIRESRLDSIMGAFIKKLETVGKPVEFTELERQIDESFRTYGKGSCHLRYVPWYFPLDMSEDDIVGAVREAYSNAGKRSRKIAVSEIDSTNIGMGYAEMPGCRAIRNYEELYQGRAGDLVIRFLVDFKNMEIVTAYPVFKEACRYGTIYSYHAGAKLFM